MPCEKVTTIHYIIEDFNDHVPNNEQFNKDIIYDIKYVSWSV